MFERRGQPLLPRAVFLGRLARYALITAALVAVSLAFGILGYRWLEGMSWVDAFVNAAMLMGGMGPVGELHTVAGKVFAGLYALYCGLVFIISIGLLATPVFHRLIHKFHLEADRDDAPPLRRRPPPPAPGSR